MTGLAPGRTDPPASGPAASPLMLYGGISFMSARNPPRVTSKIIPRARLSCAAEGAPWACWGRREVIADLRARHGSGPWEADYGSQSMIYDFWWHQDAQVLELRTSHDPTQTFGFAGVVIDVSGPIRPRLKSIVKGRVSPRRHRPSPPGPARRRTPHPHLPTSTHAKSGWVFQPFGTPIREIGTIFTSGYDLITAGISLESPTFSCVNKNWIKASCANVRFFKDSREASSGFLPLSGNLGFKA